MDQILVPEERIPLLHVLHVINLNYRLRVLHRTLSCQIPPVRRELKPHAPKMLSLELLLQNIRHHAVIFLLTLPLADVLQPPLLLLWQVVKLSFLLILQVVAMLVIVNPVLFIPCLLPVRTVELLVAGYLVVYGLGAVKTVHGFDGAHVHVDVASVLVLGS